ncbi:MAG: hypothetical protein LCH86_09850 [Proteobacteria bacterium]|nr:hypothetical protein [Pseudomonadota bacterium]
MARTVSEFYIVPPAHRAAEIIQSSERLKGHMERFFPRYTFRIDAIIPFQQGDDFTLVPLMGTVGEGSEMFEMPSRQEMHEMEAALRDYRPSAGLN